MENTDEATPQAVPHITATQPNETEQLEALTKRLAELKGRARMVANMRRMFIVFGFIAPLFSLGLAVLRLRNGDKLESIWLIGSVGLLYSALFFGAAGFLNVRQAVSDAKEVEDELDLRQMQSASFEQKAHKLLRIQQGQLSRYLEVILQQSRNIFVVGIGAMLVGVGVVIFTIWQTRSMDSQADTVQKAIVAIVGAIGAILTNYVAAIYLKMFSDIGGAVQKSVASLSQSTNVNFANVLAAYISTGDKRDEVLKEIAIGISKVP